MVKIIIGGVLCGALGFFAGFKTKAHIDDKKIDEIYAKVSKELSDMKKELEEYHKLFVTSNPEIAGEREQLWKQVSEDIKKGRKQLAEEKATTKPESERESPEGLMHKRDSEDFTDYRAIMTKNKYDCDLEEEDHGVVRKSAKNGIYEIEEYEYRESHEFPVADLYYYEMSTDVYDDQENMLDPAEIPLYLGYNQEELAIRFLHTDEPQYIYVRNPDHGKIYCVYVAQGVGPE